MWVQEEKPSQQSEHSVRKPQGWYVSMNIKKTRVTGAESEGKGRGDRGGVIVGGRKAQIT